MTGAGRRWVAAIVGVAATLAAPAFADDAVTAIRVTYGSPGDCPGPGDFTSQVLRRTARLRLARPDEAGVVPMKVTLALGRHGYQGRLEVTRSDGRVLDREVDGETCEEVVAALALVTALAFDPHASSEPLAPLPEAAPTVGPAREPTSPPPAAASPRAAHRAPEATPRPRSPEPSRWHAAFGIGLGIRSGVTPDPIVVAPVLAGFDLALAEPFTLSLLASFERSQTDEIEVSRGHAAFRWTAAALEACPIAWARGPVTAAPCLRIEGGVLEAEGSQIVPARSERRAWVALGPAGRVQWVFLEPLFAEVGGALMTPLVRDRFFFWPDATVHRPPLVGASGRVGLGVRFP